MLGVPTSHAGGAGDYIKCRRVCRWGVGCHLLAVGYSSVERKKELVPIWLGGRVWPGVMWMLCGSGLPTFRIPCT